MSFLNTRFASKAAIAGGAAFAAGGVVQIVHSQGGSGEDVVGIAGHLSLGFFALALLLTAAGYVALGGLARSDKAAKIVAIGVVALGITCLTSLINGHDLPIFVVVAPITNAMWLFGSIALAVSLKRAGRVHRAVYIGLPVIWFAAIPLGTLGGGVIAGAYWMAVGYLLSEGGLETRTEAAPKTDREAVPAIV